MDSLGKGNYKSVSPFFHDFQTVCVWIVKDALIHAADVSHMHQSNTDLKMKLQRPALCEDLLKEDYD